MYMIVDGSNFFHTGWLACFLGLPREHPSRLSLQTHDVVAFEDGWDMCHDTPAKLRPMAFDGMSRLEQAKVEWFPGEAGQ